MSALSVTEVVAAIWGKVARGELEETSASVLDRAFLGDLRQRRFEVLALGPRVTARSIGCVRRHRLRGADAVQLASALLAREADPAVNVMAVFDERLRAAASREGFALLPAS